MKKIITTSLLVLSFLPAIVAAQALNVNTSVSVDASTKNASSSVKVKAKAVRGWDEQKKAEFITMAKTHAQLKSGQDLENFAKGILVTNENVEKVEVENNEVRVTYKLPAKFFGVFGSSLKTEAGVSFDETKKTPKEVTVRFPWYRMFYSLDADARQDVIEAAIEASIAEDPGMNSGTEISKKGRSIQLISNIFRNIRIQIESDVEAE